MKRVFGLVIGFLVLLTAAQAWAQPGPRGMYFSGNMGFGVRPNADIAGPSGNEFDNDPAFVINGAIGMELNPMVRAEGEIGWHRNAADIADGTPPQDFSFSVISFMGNGYFDIPTNSPVRPYLGAGIGFALVGVQEDVFGDDTDSDLVGAFQLMGGVGFDINPQTTLTFGYRYFTTTDPAFRLAASGPFETEYTSHDFMFGARFRF